MASLCISFRYTLGVVARHQAAADINTLRDRQLSNMLATLLHSRGTPMMLLPANARWRLSNCQGG
jgi:pullulanase/glycogen debranching enzyme